MELKNFKYKIAGIELDLISEISNEDILHNTIENEKRVDGLCVIVEDEKEEKDNE